MGPVTINKAIVTVICLFHIVFSDSPHNFTRVRPEGPWIPNVKSPCAVCHRAHQTKERFLIPFPPGSPVGYLTRTGEILARDRVCLRCHTDRPTMLQIYPNIVGHLSDTIFLHRDLTDDHPVGTVVLQYHPPPADDSRGLRLDENGRLLCTTCHDAHVSAEPFLLRLPVRELCQSCHLPSDESFGHRDLACDQCHRMHTSPNPALVDVAQTGKACSSCHAVISPQHGQGVPPSKTPTPETNFINLPPGHCLNCHRFHTSTNEGNHVP